MSALLEVAGLGKRYGKIRIIEDISFSIGRGEVVGLVGESGSGKTTVARTALRLIEPSAGVVRFEGQDLSTLKGAALRRMRARMQYVFQDPYASLSGRMTVLEILGEGLAIQGVPRAERRARAVAALAQVELGAEALERYPHEFSGGQRQRIGIARALALAPTLLVADEPVSALDVSIQAQVINLLRGLQQKLGLGMLFISHDLAVVEYLCDRVLVLYLGRVMEAAPSEALYSAPLHPYTQALLASVPRTEPGAGKRALLQGEVPSVANPPSGCVFRTRCPRAEAGCASAVPPLRDLGAGRQVACHLV